VFPAQRHDQIRAMLSESLRLIVSQQLLRTAEGSSRVLAAEVLINTPAAAAIIRSGQSHKLESVIQAGGRAGMQSLDAKLRELVRKEVISGDEASEHAVDRSKFERQVVREEAA
jgi:twitching motility protein PilT